jgi:arsenate reductase
LFAHMAAHPTLVQRPIGILGERAVIGRPHTELLKLVN